MPLVPSLGQPAIHGPERDEDVPQIMRRFHRRTATTCKACFCWRVPTPIKANLAAALIWCDKAIAADKMSARAYYLRATILQEQGSLPEALFALKQTVYAEPRFVLGHFSLGNLALKQGELKESGKHFENVLLLLAQHEPEDIVPESEGLSAGRLREMIVSRLGGAVAAATGAELSRRTFRRADQPK